MVSKTNAFLQIERGDVEGYKHHDTISLDKGIIIIGRKLAKIGNDRKVF